MKRWLNLKSGYVHMFGIKANRRAELPSGSVGAGAAAAHARR